MPSAVIKGCCRLLILANNDNAFGIQENLTEQDTQAIGERIIYIQADNRARNYLRELGGRQHTDSWTKEYKIARHILWLKNNRKIEQGSRLLVEGNIQDYHRKLALRKDLDILSYALEAAEEDKHMHAAFAADEGLYVNTNGLLKIWPLFNTDEKRPRKAYLVRVLQNHAGVQKRFKVGSRYLRYHHVNAKTMNLVASLLQLDWDTELAEKMGRGSTELLRE